MLVGPADAGLAALLRGLDGRRPQRTVLADAAPRRPGPPARSPALLDGLRGRRAAASTSTAADLLAADAGPAAAARTAAELPAALRRRPARPGGRAGAATVVVEGATRVGRAAGRDARRQRGRPGQRPRPGPGRAPATPSSAGSSAADEGRPRALAAADAVRRASPLTDLRPLPDGAAADLVVLARPWAAVRPAGRRRRSAPACRTWSRRCAEQTGVVGPLVRARARPAACAARDLHRRDADPRWPRLAAQLTAADAAAQRRHRHLPAHRRRPRPSRCSPTSTAAPHRRPWTRRWSCARPTCLPAAAAVAAAPGLRLRSGADRRRAAATRAGDAGPSGASARQGTMGG